MQFMLTQQKFASLESGSHIIGIYSDSHSMYSEAFQFLKAGFDNNEAILMITDRLSKEQTRQAIVQHWQITEGEIRKLEESGQLLLRTTKEWYFPGDEDTSTLNVERTLMQWGKAVEAAVKNNNKKGLRAFGDMHFFFEHDDGNNALSRQLVDYEALLEPQVPFPLIGLCAYESRDIASLSPQQLAALHLHHSPQWVDGYDILEHPQDNQHIALIYDADDKRDIATSRYINEGLKRNQLCVYASVHLRENAYKERISLMIENYEENVAKGNLILVDLAPYYVSAMSDNFAPFEELKQELINKVSERADKHIRLVGDCVAFLFQNKHFDEFMRLEEWWEQKPFEGSYLCPFPKNILDQYPYDLHKFRIHFSHDIVANDEGKIVSAYVPDTGQKNIHK